MAASRPTIKREDTVFESIETQSELLYYLIECFKQGKISEIEIPIENSISNAKGIELFPKGTIIKLNLTRGDGKDNFYLNGEFIFDDEEAEEEEEGAGGGGKEPSAESSGKFKRKDDMIINWHLSIHSRDPEEQERISKKIQNGESLTTKEKSYWNQGSIHLKYNMSNKKEYTAKLRANEKLDEQNILVFADKVTSSWDGRLFRTLLRCVNNALFNFKKICEELGATKKSKKTKKKRKPTKKKRKHTKKKRKPTKNKATKKKKRS